MPPCSSCSSCMLYIASGILVTIVHVMQLSNWCTGLLTIWTLYSVNCFQTSAYTTMLVSLPILSVYPCENEGLVFFGFLLNHESYYELDTLWELTCHQSTTNYDIILDHTHVLFLCEGEKNAIGKIAKPRAVPVSPGASTFATAKSDNSSN